MITYKKSTHHFNSYLYSNTIIIHYSTKKHKHIILHRTTQFFDLLLVGWPFNAIWTASLNTTSKLCRDRAEHSIYLAALIAEAITIPSLWVTIFCPLWFIFFANPESFLKSTFVPTKMIGVSGEWCFSSGCHFSVMFLRDTVSTNEKQSKKTSLDLVRWFWYEDWNLT